MLRFGLTAAVLTLALDVSHLPVMLSMLSHTTVIARDEAESVSESDIIQHF